MEQPITEQARKVLETVRFASDKYDTNPPSGQDWVLHWAATVALLRAVGHALEAVDTKTSPNHKKAIDEAWEEWMTAKDRHPIFWQFIQEERNSILHQFELHAGQGVNVHLDGTPHEYTYPFEGDETFAGKTQQDMIREGIEWWELQLTQIEAAIAKSSS